MGYTLLKGYGDIDEIATSLGSNLINIDPSIEFVKEIRKQVSDVDVVYVMVYEKFYFRNRSRTSLTVVLSKEEDIIVVELISSGGSPDLLFKTNFGSERNFEKIIVKMLVSKGFYEYN